ncbi:MarR family winged helix-turn-helix transcriptional regulator [Pediococcus siamensis]|uniref:MarR family winged helix-turn-helix transcriptional regulator n=1 Tax=Pediococcus siamensis TaxID=381829 RepID=UPI0039A3DE53
MTNVNSKIDALIHAIRLQKEVDLAQKLAPLSPRQALILSLIEKQPGLLQKDIVAVTKTQPASVSSFLKKLEDNGLILRHVPAENARNKEIYITQAGQKIVNQFNKANADINRKMLGSLSKEQKDQLITLLAKIEKSYRHSQKSS